MIIAAYFFKVAVVQDKNKVCNKVIWTLIIGRKTIGGYFVNNRLWWLSAPVFQTLRSGNEFSFESFLSHHVVTIEQAGLNNNAF